MIFVTWKIKYIRETYLVMTKFLTFEILFFNLGSFSPSKVES